MKKTLFSLVVIAALQMSFIASSEAETPCSVEEAPSEYVNCQEALRSADRQRDRLIAEGSSISDANRSFCIIWSYSTNGQCGPCRYQ